MNFSYKKIDGSVGMSHTHSPLHLLTNITHTYMLKRFFIFASILLLPSAVIAQAVGSWRTYFSYNNVNKVTDGGDFIYALSDGFLLSLNKEYESLDTYSKIQGMSDTKITDIAYGKNRNTLLITYSNCNIDLLKDGKFHNIPDLKRKSISDKRINSIAFHDNHAYLSCGFGIVTINLDKNEIADTYIIGKNGGYLNITATAIVNDSIFALTSDGIYCADISNKNLANYENWARMDISIGISGITCITSFANRLTIIKNGNVYKYADSEWEIINEGVDNLQNTEDNLILYSKNKYINYKKDWSIQEEGTSSLEMSDITYSKKGNCYFAACKNEDATNLTKMAQGTITNTYSPNGPFSTSVAFAKIRNNKIITGSGGPFDLSMNTPGLIQIYENGKWTIIRDKDILEKTNGEVELMDVLDAEFDPVDPNRFYIASWRSLFEFYNDTLVKHYTAEETTLEMVSSSLLLLDGLNFDSDNNLWMINMLAKDILKVKKADGTWESLYYSGATSKETAKELFFGSNGYKWILFPRSGAGVLVIDDNKTPFKNSDDRNCWHSSFYENSSDGLKTVTPSTYRCIAEDKNGIIWIGTNIGPLLIQNPDKAFDDDFYVDRIKITRADDSNYADYLLANEQINAIVVDGANRKWIGTATSGVYLLSEDGQETIHHFTVDNSPLTSDAIMDIALNEKTGEVLFVTANSMISYMSDAIEGCDSYSDVYVYPNPVKENYDGPIVIKGLIENSVIKIADIKGNVVWQGRSNGGIYTWNGTYKNGKRVNSGVYLVFMALDDGSEKAVAKIAIIN